MTTVPIDQRDLDVTEEQLIQEFKRDGCKCDLGPSRTPCSLSITVDHLRAVRCQMADLTHDELDLVVMGVFRGNNNKYSLLATPHYSFV